MSYRVNEIFYSLQGEGVRAGTANVFVRFSGCNLQCNVKEQGFDCDTEFVSGRDFTADELVKALRMFKEDWGAEWVIWTGGEPGLQLDQALVDAVRKAGWMQAVETNGTKPLPEEDLDWICVSPKTAEHTLCRDLQVDELKYVRRAGQGIPKPVLKATHHLISPAFQPDSTVLKEDLDWCIQLCKENPKWRLSVQQHKLWKVR